MKFQTHNDAEIETLNVSWTFSTIQATKTQLTRAFGEPLEMMGDKVQFEWIIKFEDGTVATIYDWKKPVIEDHHLITWNIGGDAVKASGKAVSAVHNAFREAHGLSARSA